MLGTEIEALLRKLIREEFARLMGEAPANDDDDELKELVARRAAKMRAARGGGR
jgi:hypothetical protein